MESENQTIDQQASAWVARRDRGFAPAEQDEFLQWLRDDPRHAAAFSTAERAWTGLDRPGTWRPAHSAPTNPDLLAAAPTKSRARTRWFSAVIPLALAAAAVATAFATWRVPKKPTVETAVAPRPGVVRHQPQQLSLPEGSVVELDAGAHVDVAYIPTERRVYLTRGEAHFTVVKDPARPFVVNAGGASVRAVGTSFSVRRGDTKIAVFVTEGVVRVGRSSPTGPGVDFDSGPMLAAGQRTVIDTSASDGCGAVVAIGADDLERELAWRRVRLQFEEIPLADVAAEFNRYNQHKLVVNDAATGALRVGGDFRADNVDAFVRLLTASFGVTATQRDDDTTVLARAP